MMHAWMITRLALHLNAKSIDSKNIQADRINIVHGKLFGRYIVV
jgi:hypothetical protein